MKKDFIYAAKATAIFFAVVFAITLLKSCDDAAQKRTEAALERFYADCKVNPHLYQAYRCAHASAE